MVFVFLTESGLPTAYRKTFIADTLPVACVLAEDTAEDRVMYFIRSTSEMNFH